MVSTSSCSRKEYQGDCCLQQRVGLTVKEFQEMIGSVDNISMGPSNTESSKGEAKISETIGQSHMGVAEIKKNCGEKELNVL